MAVEFPTNPALDQVFYPPDGGAYKFDGDKWVSVVPNTNYADISGPQGATGPGFTNSSAYDPGTGQVTFTSNDGLGFVTGDLRGATGADGADGPALDISSLPTLP